MSAQSVAGPTRRPNSPDSDDAIMVRALEFTAWARTNIRLILIGGAIVIAILAGLIYWRVYREDRNERAAAEFLQLQQTAASGNAQLAARDLEAFAHRYDGSVYADEARIALAQLHLQADSAAAAVQVLNGAGDRIDDTPVGPQAALLLAAAQQAAGDNEAAIRTYTAVADEADLSFRRVDALEALAQLHARMGDYAAAADVYQRLVDESGEGTPERQVYEMRLAEAQARAGN
jgi:predicted negative regulator of RcsB-dependent stress response